MEKKVVVVSFIIPDNGFDIEHIEAAIKRGLAFGLDVKHICNPNEIEEMVITIA